MLNVTQHFKSEIHNTLSQAFDKVINTFNKRTYKTDISAILSSEPSVTSETSPNNYATTGSEYADNVFLSDFTEFYLPNPYNLKTLDTTIKSLDDKEIK